jgi:hypothetical protein
MTTSTKGGMRPGEPLEYETAAPDDDAGRAAMSEKRCMGCGSLIDESDWEEQHDRLVSRRVLERKRGTAAFGVFLSLLQTIAFAVWAEHSVHLDPFGLSPWRFVIWGA